MSKNRFHRQALSFIHLAILFFCLLGSWFYCSGQDLQPRAYIRVPVNVNVILPGFNYSHGKILTDPNIPLTDFKANVEMFSFAYARTFSFFGLTAQALVAQPFCFAQASAIVNSQTTSVDRTGFADTRARMSVLLLGGKALTMAELVKNKERRTILGTSLTIQAPTGQYFSNKLVNIGTGRWAFKPEIALSQPLGTRWLLDLYTSVWLFTNNDAYFPGTAFRSQNPIYAFQWHVSYNIGAFAWAAFDATYYAGGNSTVNQQPKDDHMSNARYGATLVIPTSKRSGLKFAVSDGAVVTRGQNFTEVSVGWSYAWPGKK